jgi:two-component system, LytTR family, sensor kinase
MPIRSLLQQARWRWGLFFAFWTLAGLFFAAQFFFASAQFGNPITWRRALTTGLADWYLFGLLSLPVLGLARLLPFEQPVFWRSMTLHLVASGLFAVLYMVLRAWIGTVETEAAVTFAAVFNPLVVRTFHFNVLIYWLVVGFCNAVGYYRKFRERELEAAELEKRLTEARLHTLQAQINPHFLFNTLNAIASLMHKDVEAADRALVRLSELLRLALESVESQEVTLRSELAFLSRYLEIEQIRFGNRLEVQMEIPPDTLEALVPNLVLQPLVENAVLHGIQPHARPGRIVLQARRDGERLRLRVLDSGNGAGATLPAREGVGLSNTRARLRLLYGEAQWLRLRPAAGGGMEAEIECPFRTAAGDFPRRQ